MARVFDCFTFFNELDLLEIRLHELSNVVDVFVISEAAFTHQGGPKPLHFQQNKQRFAPFHDRIRHIVVDSMPEGPGEPNNFRREYHQRNRLIAGLHDASPDDVILLSDVDEIPRSGSLRAAVESHDTFPTVHCLELTMCVYFVNYVHSEPWSRAGPRLTRRRFLSSMQGLRNVHPPTPHPFRSMSRWLSASFNMGRPIRRAVHPDAGWHFSSMGGIDRVAQKLSAFSHVIPERRTNPSGSITDMAAARVRSAITDDDLRNVELDTSYPAYLLENRERFAHLLAER